jgi:hypothetical protein
MKTLGLAGLLAGWLAKSAIELGLLALFGRPARAPAAA